MYRSPSPVVVALAIVILIYVIVRDWIRHRASQKTGVVVRRFNIARDFSRFPTGAENSLYSGKSLRALVRGMLTEPGPLVINLDGTFGYSSSFLKAAFEGLGAEFPDIRQRLSFETEDDESLITEIWEYATEVH